MNFMKVEVCSTSLQGIKNAASAGADRVELCSALGVGGVTPSAGLIKEAVKLNVLPIHCLIRPREGHFSYTSEEVAVIEQDILTAKELGCKGVVVGALTPEFNLDVKRLMKWKNLAGDMYVTFHRAFDVVRKPLKALEQLIDLGIDCILTSGQEEKAIQGFSALEEWNKKLGERIVIMPGSGVSEKNCVRFKEAGFKALHLSGSAALDPIIIPEGVNNEISFLRQQLRESNISIIKEVVRTVNFS
jgi:copper homeostasis protein